MATSWKGVVIGEAMIELGHMQEKLTQTYGGDTLNTAIYLHRASSAPIEYITAVGRDDPFSKGMLEFMRANGIGTDMIQKIADKLPGLYAIEVNSEGERRFYYWRGESAARGCFETADADAILATLWSYDLIHFSGITLAILHETGRAKLLDTLENASRRGVKISFDFNFRQELWHTDPAPIFKRAMSFSHWAFMSLAELKAAGFKGLQPDSPELATAIASLGAHETIIRDGAKGGAVYLQNGKIIPMPTPEKLQPVDTTAAGDSFTGAYLARAMAGKSVEECIMAAQKMAACVIMHPGAIIDSSLMPEL